MRAGDKTPGLGGGPGKVWPSKGRAQAETWDTRRCGRPQEWHVQRAGRAGTGPWDMLCRGDGVVQAGRARRGANGDGPGVLAFQDSAFLHQRSSEGGDTVT